MSTRFIAIVLVCIANAGCEMFEPPTEPTPLCAPGGDLYDRVGCEDQFPVSVAPVVEPGIERISLISAVEYRGGARHFWDVSVTWTPNEAFGSCRWFGTGGLERISDSGPGYGSCNATFRGTPSGGDAVTITVTDRAGREFHQNRQLSAFAG